MKNKTLLTTLLATVAIGAIHHEAHAFEIGDFAFTSFNSQEDGWSLLTMVSIPANTVLYFTDNEATSTTAFNTGESYHLWNSGSSIIPAGTVIRFSAIDSSSSLAASIGTLSRATVSGSSNYGISTSGDTVYLFEGTSASSPTKILTAISSVGASEITSGGLTAGTNAVAIATNALFTEYTGTRTGLTSLAAYAALINNPANWSTSVSNSSAVPNTAGFSAVPEPSTFVGLIGGLGIVAMRRRRIS